MPKFLIYVNQQNCQTVIFPESIITLTDIAAIGGKMNDVKFIIAGTEFDSFQVSNDSEEIVSNFKEVYSSKIEPMLNHIVELQRK